MMLAPNPALGLWGWGFRVLGSGFRDFGSRDEGLGFRVFGFGV